MCAQAKVAQFTREVHDARTRQRRVSYRILGETERSPCTVITVLTKDHGARQIKIHITNIQDWMNKCLTHLLFLNFRQIVLGTGSHHAQTLTYLVADNFYISFCRFKFVNKGNKIHRFVVFLFLEK